MASFDQKHLSADKAEVLGICGQNGSGKTAIVDALYFLQKVMAEKIYEETDSLKIARAFKLRYGRNMTLLI